MIVFLFVWTQYRNVTDGRNPSGYYSALHCEQCGRAVKNVTVSYIAMFYTANFVAYNCSLCLNHDQRGISQCAQCARSRDPPTSLEAPPPGKRENGHAKVLSLRCGLSVLKQQRLRKVIRFHGKKCRGPMHQKSTHNAEIR